MLPRDIDSDNYLRRYYPKTDVMSFQKDMFNADRNMLHLLAFDKKDLDESMSRSNNMMYLTVATAVTSSLVGIVFFNKLPLFGRIQGKWKRFFARTFLFLGPIYGVSIYNIYNQSTSLEKYHQKYFPQYVKYKCTGNILDLNPDIKRK